MKGRKRENRLKIRGRDRKREEVRGKERENKGRKGKREIQEN